MSFLLGILETIFQWFLSWALGKEQAADAENKALANKEALQKTQRDELNKEYDDAKTKEDRLHAIDDIAKH